MSSLEALSKKAAQFVWGPALLLLVLFGGAFLTVASGFYPLHKLRFIIKSTFGSLKGKSGGFAAAFKKFEKSLDAKKSLCYTSICI